MERKGIVTISSWIKKIVFLICLFLSYVLLRFDIFFIRNNSVYIIIFYTSSAIIFSYMIGKIFKLKSPFIEGGLIAIIIPLSTVDLFILSLPWSLGGKPIQYFSNFEILFLYYKIMILFLFIFGGIISYFSSERQGCN